jgi:hypothetical protein
MPLFRLTLNRVAIAWAVFLWTVALVLPQLGPRTQAYPAVKAIVAVVFALLLIGTPVALITHFNRAWRRVATVPNRAAYVTWLSLETIAGAAVVGFLAYGVITFAVARLR